MSKLYKRTKKDDLIFRIINSQIINPITEDLGENEFDNNVKSHHIINSKTRLNFQKKNYKINNLSVNENEKIGFNKGKKDIKKINKSIESSRTYSSTNKYWEKRYIENEMKMEKIRKNEEYKKLKELKNKPNISYKSKKIAESLKNIPLDFHQEKFEKSPIEKNKINDNYKIGNNKINNNYKNEKTKIYDNCKIKNIKNNKINKNNEKNKKNSNKTLFQKYRLNVADYMSLKKIVSIRKEEIELRNQNLRKILNEENNEPIHTYSCTNLINHAQYKSTNDEQNHTINDYNYKKRSHSTKKIIKNKEIENNNNDEIRKKLNENYNLHGKIINHTYLSENEDNEDKIMIKNHRVQSLIESKPEFIEYPTRIINHQNNNFTNINQSEMINNNLFNNNFYDLQENNNYQNPQNPKYNNLNIIYSNNNNLNQNIEDSKVNFINNNQYITNQLLQNIEDGQNKLREIQNNVINNSEVKNYLIENDPLIKYRHENNLRLQNLQKIFNDINQDSEKGNLTNYELDPIYNANIQNKNNLKQRYDNTIINNEITSARNNLEYLNEKLKINEQKRKMIMDKYLFENKNNSKNISRNKILLKKNDNESNSYQINYHTQDNLTGKLNDFYYHRNFFNNL